LARSAAQRAPFSPLLLLADLRAPHVSGFPFFFAPSPTRTPPGWATDPGFVGISSFRVGPSFIKLPSPPRRFPFTSKPANSCPSPVFLRFASHRCLPPPPGVDTPLRLLSARDFPLGELATSLSTGPCSHLGFWRRFSLGGRSPASFQAARMAPPRRRPSRRPARRHRSPWTRLSRWIGCGRWGLENTPSGGGAFC
jgi:hypothetical protein